MTTPAEQPVPAGGLTHADVDMLHLEAHWWKHQGSKEQAIRAQLGLTSTAYYRRLNQLIDTPQALAYAPTLVNRLRAQRERRATRRTQLRLA